MSETPVRALHATAGNMYGGLEVLLATVARHRDSVPGLEHRFAVCFEGRHSAELRSLGATVDILGAVRMSRPWTVMKARRAFRRLIAEARPTALICHGTWPHSLFTREARRAGIPSIFWQHDMHGREHWLDRHASRTPTDFAIAASRASASTTGALFPGVEPAILPCPVAAPEPIADRSALRSSLRRELDTPEDA